MPITNVAILILHDVGNNRDCDVDVDHRKNRTFIYTCLSAV